MDHEVYHQELEEEKKRSKEDEMKRKPRCCIHGSNGHNTVDCKTFIDATPSERLVLGNKNKACWSCLKIGHRATQCFKKSECKEGGCSRHHHPTLHEVFVEGEASNQQHLGIRDCILQIMTIPAAGEVNTKLNVLWDGGSTLSMITLNKARELKLTGKRVQLTIVKVGGLKETTNSYQYEVPLKDKEGKTVLLIAYGIQRISSPAKAINMMNFANLFLTVPEEEITRPTGDIDMLIGFEYAGFHPTKEQSVNHLLLLKNRFGRSIGGSRKEIISKNEHSTACYIHT